MIEQPDIEIYIKNADLNEIQAWLGSHFDVVPEGDISDINIASPRTNEVELQRAGLPVPLVITPQAAGKAYLSVWFKSPKTPWQNDLECAQSALERFDTEVRCSAESWAEEEPEHSEKWWKLTRTSKDLVSWG